MDRDLDDDCVLVDSPTGVPPDHPRVSADCLGGCGFYGSTAFGGFCSKCFSARQGSRKRPASAEVAQGSQANCGTIPDEASRQCRMERSTMPGAIDTRCSVGVRDAGPVGGCDSTSSESRHVFQCWRPPWMQTSSPSAPDPVQPVTGASVLCSGTGQSTTSAVQDSRAQSQAACPPTWASGLATATGPLVSSAPGDSNRATHEKELVASWVPSAPSLPFSATAAPGLGEVAAGRRLQNSMPVPDSGWVAPVPSAIPSAPEVPPPLSEQQSKVVDLVLVKNRSIFFTGSAGTGKSRTLREIMDQANRQTTRITAMTGIAASHLPGATTLHSFAGVGLAKESKEKLLDMVRGNPQKVKGWKQCQLLIVDEASMMSKKLFETVEYIARMIRQRTEPFGGVKLCLCGDFFQLPPVSRGNPNSDESLYCFDSPLWEKCVDHCVELTKVFRQKDAQLLDLLNEVRFGQATKTSLDLLCQLRRPLPASDIKPTRLYPANVAVDSINKRELDAIPGETRVYRAKDVPPHMTEQLTKMSMYPQSLELKVGAQVMMLKNVGDLVNGSRGVVTDFHLTEGGIEVPIVKWMHGGRSMVTMDESSRETPTGLLKRIQLPLKLSWAMTIHKSQGMSIDRLEVDLKHVFEKGQAYVALSRARSLEGLCVTAFDATRFWTDPRVVAFYQNSVRPVECFA